MRYLIALVLASLSTFNVHAQALVFPEPTGDFAVGRTEILITDADRAESYTEDPDDSRELLLTVFYPTDAEADPSPYVDGAQQTALSEVYGVPEEFWDVIWAHSSVHAPIAAAAPFPVLIFSAGLGNQPLLYTALLEDLASQGFVVVRITRPYNDPVSVLPDGRVIVAPAAAIPLTEEDRQATGRIWADDVISVLDALEGLNMNDEGLAGVFDLERVGAFGHSFGGAAATEAAFHDSRIDAVVNMDGTLFGDVTLTDDNLRVPFMVMQEVKPVPTPPSDAELVTAGVTREQYERFSHEAMLERVLASTPNGYKVSISGAAHNTFTSDMVLLAPISNGLITAEEVGTIASLEAVNLVNAYVSAFFKTYVKGEETPLPAHPAAMIESYPE